MAWPILMAISSVHTGWDSPPFIALAKAMKAGYGVAGADEDDRQEHRCESTHKCEFTPNFTAVIDSVSSALMMLLIPVEQREFMPV